MQHCDLSSCSSDTTRASATVDILLVEDDTALRTLLCDALQQDGYSVLQAPNGRAAMDLMIEHQPRLIVVDMFMPEADGIEVLRLARRQSPVPGAIAMSGSTVWDGPLFERISRLLGADHILIKPFDLTDLLAVVRTSIGGPQ